LIAEAAVTYMRLNQHDEALQILRTIILRKPGSSKVVSLLQMIRCQIEIGQIFAAITTSQEVTKILNTKTGELHSQTKARCHEELLTVVARFIEIEKMDTAFLLLQSHFTLLKDFYTGEIKLHRINKLGGAMEQITQKFYCQSTYKSKDCCIFLGNMLREMQKLIQIDNEEKARAIVSFIKHYGNCCNNFYKYSKSVDLFKQAIFYMNSMYGEYAESCQLLGDCHYNLALALEHSTKFDDVVEACNAALDIYEQANDWDNVEQKNISVSLVTRMKEKIKIRSNIYELFWVNKICVSEEESRKLKYFPSVTAKKPRFPIATPFLNKRSRSYPDLRRRNSFEFQGHVDEYCN